MSLSYSQVNRLHELLFAMREERLTDADFRELETLVLSNPSARRLFVRTMQLHSSLLWVNRATAGLELPSPETLQSAAVSMSPVVTPIPPRRRSLMGFVREFAQHIPGGEFTVGALVVLVVAAAYWGLSQAILAPHFGGRELTAEVEQNGSNGSVAAIGGSADVKWAHQIQEKHEADPIQLGELLEINSGIVELQLQQGTTLVVEGPAQWTIDGNNHATLKRGKLVAKVPKQATGFTLDTPSLRIVDLGTEFGAEVTESGNATVRVFEGKVDVSLEAATPAGKQTERLSAGQSRRVERIKDKLQLVEEGTESNRFIRKIEQRSSRGPVVGDKRQQLLNDAALLAHFQFEARDEEPARLVNLAAATRGKYDGKIHGAKWGAGSKPGRSALYFEKPGDRVEFGIDGEYTSLTVAASIFFEPLPRHPNYTPILMGNLWGTPGQFHWQLHQDGKPNISICGDKGSVHAATCPQKFSKEDFGRWLKIAVIMDTKTREAVFLVDGAIVGTTPMPPCDHLVLDAMSLGHWIPWKKDSPRDLAGRIEEFSVFGRALWPAELRVLMLEEGPPNE